MDEFQKQVVAEKQKYEEEKTEDQVIELQRQLEENKFCGDEQLELQRQHCQQTEPAEMSQVMPVADKQAAVISHVGVMDSAMLSSVTDSQESTSNYSESEAKSIIIPELQQQKNKSITSDDNNISDDWTISKDSYERVMITAKMGHGDYFVKKMNPREDLDTMFENLKSHAAATKIRVKPCVNQKCLLNHERYWCRVIVKEIYDINMKVFFMDLGFFKDVFIRNVVPIDGFENIPCYAGRINFDKSTDLKFMNLEIGEFIDVKAVDVNDNGTPVVEVEEDRKEKAKEEALEKLATFPNVLDTLQIQKNRGILILHSEVGQNELIASLVPKNLEDSFKSLMKNLSKTCKAQVTEYPKFEPNIGDLICGQEENGDWYRGIVISLNPIKLAVIDEARVHVPVKCVPLPKDYLDIASFGVIVKLTTTDSANLAGRTLEFKVLKDSSSKDNSIVVSLNTNKKPAYIGEATLTKWMPKPGQKGITWAKLTSGCLVQIIRVSRLNEIFVYNQEDTEEDRRDFVEQEMNKAGLCRFPVPKGLPFVSQFVLVQCGDHKYCRAYVEKVESDSTIHVMNVDSGNQAIVRVEQLFELPDVLKEETACAAKIKLKGIEENIPMTQEAMDYLVELMTHKVSLTCTFTGNPLTDGVVLKTPTDDIVNDILANITKPTRRKSDENRCILC